MCTPFEPPDWLRYGYGEDESVCLGDFLMRNGFLLDLTVFAVRLKQTEIIIMLFVLSLATLSRISSRN